MSVSLHRLAKLLCQPLLPLQDDVGARRVHHVDLAVSAASLGEKKPRCFRKRHFQAGVELAPPPSHTGTHRYKQVYKGTLYIYSQLAPPPSVTHRYKQVHTGALYIYSQLAPPPSITHTGAHRYTIHTQSASTSGPTSSPICAYEIPAPARARPRCRGAGWQLKLQL